MRAPQRHKPPPVGRKSPRNYHVFYRQRIWWNPIGLRANQLNKEPLCRECAKTDRDTPATEVDHIIPHRGNWQLFCDVKNLQSLCRSCHNAKTARGE